MPTVVNRVASRLLFSVVSIACCASTLHGQSPASRVISGRVIDEAGQVVPYATVSTPAGAQTTARPDGTFRLPLAVATGVTVVVRQIGFHPESLTVALDTSGAAPPDVTIRITRNPIRLSPVVVSALDACSASDPGDARTRAELRPVFDALQENVYRTLALLRAYPIGAEMAVALYDSSAKGRGKVKNIKNKRTSAGTWLPYEPGNVIRYSDRGSMIVPLSMGFLVDSVFKSRHCFWYAGEETLDGRQTLRIDFAPNSLVTSVDWAGSIVLDAKSYVLRAQRSLLVHPVNTKGKLQYMNWSTMYEEIFPGLIDMASDRRVRWTADASKVEAVKPSVIETRTVKRTFKKDAPGQLAGEGKRR